jgi:hypothetical protein
MKLSIYVKHEERQLSLQIHIIHIVLILDYQLITLYKYIVDRYAQLMHNLHRTRNWTYDGKVWNRCHISISTMDIRSNSNILAL